MLVGYRIAMDQMMIEPARFVVRTVAAQGIPAFEYRFSYVADSLRDKLPGAPHATEILFVFDTVNAAYKGNLTPHDEQIAKQVHAYWVSFAKTGVPAPAGLPVWLPYSLQSDALIDFTATGPVVRPDPWKDRLDLAESLAAQPPAPAPAPVHTPAPASAGQAFTSGGWNISGDIMGYPLKETCNLNVNGSSLTGSCKGNAKAYDVTGTIDGINGTFKHTGEFNGTQLTDLYTGTLSADCELIGKVQVDPMNVSGTFTATKTAAQ